MKIILEALKNRIGSAVLFLLFLGCWSLCCVPDASAVQIKRVQTGDVYFDADDMSATIPCQQVDQTKTLILLYVEMESGVSANTGNMLFTSMFETDSSFVVNRDYATTGACTLRWYLVEFEDGVYIQRGISSFIYGTTYNNSAYRIKEVTLPVSVDAAKSFPIVQVRGNIGSATVDEVFHVTASMVDNDTLKLERDAVTDINRTINMTWQVVEFQTDVNIRSGEVSLDISQTSNTGTISPAIPSGKIGRCLFLYSHMARYNVNGIEGFYKLTGTITDENTVTFTRSSANSTANTQILARWYVIEFTDESTVVQKDSGAVTLASVLR